MSSVADDDRYYSVEEIQDAFMERLHALVPRCFASLCSSTGTQLATEFNELQLETLKNGAPPPDHADAWRAMRGHIDKWMRDYRLTAVPRHVSKLGLSVPEWRDVSSRERLRWRGSSSSYSWLHGVAYETLLDVSISKRYGEPVRASFKSQAPARTHTFHLGDTMPSIDFRAMPLSVPPMSWNPQGESRADAKARLSRYLDSALDAIEPEYPSWKVPVERIDWLVRFQVMRASQDDLACKVGCAKSTITRAINDTAELVGIEPRDGREDAGRPRRKTGRTVKVRQN